MEIPYRMDTIPLMERISSFLTGPEMITPSDFTVLEMLTPTRTGLECEVWLGNLFLLAFP